MAKRAVDKDGTDLDDTEGHIKRNVGAPSERTGRRGIRPANDPGGTEFGDDTEGHIKGNIDASPEQTDTQAIRPANDPGGTTDS